MNPQSAPVSQVPLEVALAVSVVGLVLLLGWGRSARVTSGPAWGGLWYAVPPALVTLGLLAVGVSVVTEGGGDLGAVLASGLIQQVLILVVLVGIFEEVLFRGVVLHGLERRIGPVAALLASSALFGAMHYVNWVNGQSLCATHAQVVHAGLSGLLYGALALRTRSVWPGAALHALWDFVVTANGAFLGSAFGDAPPGADEPESLPMLALHYFEPILGLVVLAGWWRWHRRQPPPSWPASHPPEGRPT
nr:CPBP family intramembrane glutamic endopeptidase [Jannaschia sp. Os4]